MTDEEMIQLLHARDEKRLDALRKKYGRLLKSVAYGILRSAQDAEECESEALLRAWNSIPPAKPEHLTGYLCQIARRAALDRYDYNSAAKRSGESLPLDELAEYISGGGAPQRKRADAPAEQLPDGSGKRYARDIHAEILVRRYAGQYANCSVQAEKRRCNLRY